MAVSPQLMNLLKEVYTYIYEFTKDNVYFNTVKLRAGGAEIDLDFMHRATEIGLDTLLQVYNSPTALVLWHDLWADMRSDLDLLRDACPLLNDGDEVRHIREYGSEYLERYQAKVNLILLYLN